MPRPGPHCGKEQILLQLGRMPVRVTVLAVAILATVAGGFWFAMNHDRASGSAADGLHGSGQATPAPAPPLQVVSVTPARHTRHVNGAAPVTIQFSAPLAADSPSPKITPDVPGQWSRPSATQLTFTPAAGFSPLTRVTVRIPGG